MEVDPDLIVTDPTLSLADGAIEAWRHHGKRMNMFYARTLRKFCQSFGVDINSPYKTISKPLQRILMKGTTAKDEKKYDTHFEGVVTNLQRRWQSTDGEYVKSKLHGYLSEA